MIARPGTWRNSTGYAWVYTFGIPGGRQLKFGSLEVSAVYSPPIGWLPLNFSAPQDVSGRVFMRWPCGSVQMKLKVFTDDGYQTPVKSPAGAAFWLAVRVCASRTGENVISAAHPSNTIL